MWSLGERQDYKCPEEFQARLTRAGGVNKYGKPNFKIVWGQSEKFRAGGTWECEDNPVFTGYRDLLLHNEPCWLLMMWYPAELYGTPESYYVQNFDEDSGLQILGEYPYQGKYEIVAPLIYKSFVNGRLNIEIMPLSSLLVNLVIPTLVEAKDVGMTKRIAVYAERKQTEDQEMEKAIGESLSKGRLAFGTSPVSYAGQVGKTMLIEKKVASLKRNLDNAMEMAQHLGKGLVQK